MSNTNAIEYDANKHSIHSVTVFQSNRAEVTRTVRLSLKNGQNEVEIKGLPTYTEEDSIRVDGFGNAVILEVIYHPPPLKIAKEESCTMEDLNDKRASIQDELTVLDQQSDILLDYSRTLNGKETSSAQLYEFLGAFAERKRQMNEKRKMLTKTLDAVEKDISAAKELVKDEHEAVKRRRVNITVVVLAKGDGAAELSLTYIVPNASWTPRYDLRATIAKDEKSASSVRLHYKASILQSTGEDWTNVKLKLSTAAPLQGSQIPSLQTLWITEPPPPMAPAYRNALRMHHHHQPIIVAAPDARSSRSLSRSPRRHARRRSRSIRSYSSEDAPPFIGVMESIPTEGTLSTSFSISGSTTIPTSTAKNSRTHKVTIADLDLKNVEFDWIAIPKRIPSVFLRCRVKNTSQYVLLSGHCNVFLDNNFVTKSTIPNVSSLESFTCSLGVDPAVRVTHHPESKRTKTAGSMLGTNKTTTTAFEQRITIKNTRPSSIKNLIIKDQIPMPGDAKFKINLIDPPLQGSIGKQKGVQVKKGIVASWSASGDAELVPDGVPNGKEGESGFLDWTCFVGSGETIEVALVWEVVSPVGSKWVRQ